MERSSSGLPSMDMGIPPSPIAPTSTSPIVLVCIVLPFRCDHSTLREDGGRGGGVAGRGNRALGKYLPPATAGRIGVSGPPRRPGYAGLDPSAPGPGGGALDRVLKPGVGLGRRHQVVLAVRGLAVLQRLVRVLQRLLELRALCGRRRRRRRRCGAAGGRPAGGRAAAGAGL